MKSVEIILATFLFLGCYTSEALPSEATLAGNNPLQARLHGSAMGPEDILPPEDETKVIAACVTCQVAISLIEGELDLGAPIDYLIQEGIIICVSIVGYTQTFCDGFVPLVAPILYHIFTTNDVDSADFCGMVMSAWGCNTTDPSRDWSVDIHGEKPPVIPISLPDPDQPTLKVLHLADTHLDLLYVPGSNAACDNELCCREESGTPGSPEDEAWFWGDYRHCGSPKWMLEDMLRNIVSEHPDVSYVLWTGDLVPHNMWSTSVEWNTQIIKTTNEMIRTYFPGIPVFPVAGNHEMSPLDEYPNPEDRPAELAADWLYQTFLEEWLQIVPQGLDNSTVLHAGYYSILFKPGFRIISVNSMFGYTANVWLAENSTDIASELAWLETQLNQAEAAGELVHLLGHIPPGILYAERTWSREYNRIIRRYENIIRGQFFGHTHYDEFEVFHEGGRPIGVAYIAPSQTPWNSFNPAYRIYTIDGDRPDTTRMVLDLSMYIMNLTEAHQTNVSRWFELYNAKIDYGMASLTSDDWHDLGIRMAENRTLFDLYWRNYVNAADPYLEVGCDDICYEKRLCDFMTSDRNDLDACYKVVQKMKKAQGLLEK
ncbi:Sphingomyelin phosphodiesterase [Halocaridina rubra]|uniref:Sphingomyelin phosphodiesterase n=1 Tax=Halocaridina rubra TaxID=373956 RepID=A0AAN9AE52_HALRR